MKEIATVLSLMVFSAGFADVETVKTSGAVNDFLILDAPFFSHTTSDVGEWIGDFTHNHTWVRYCRVTVDRAPGMSEAEFTTWKNGLPWSDHFDPLEPNPDDDEIGVSFYIDLYLVPTYTKYELGVKYWVKKEVVLNQLLTDLYGYEVYEEIEPPKERFMCYYDIDPYPEVLAEAERTAYDQYNHDTYPKSTYVGGGVPL